MTAIRPELPVTTVASSAPIADTPPVVAAAPARVETSVDDPARVVVTVVGVPSGTTPAILSRALHRVLETSAPGHIVLVDLGRLDPADPAVARVLRCAHERAHSRRTDLQILPHVAA